MQDLTNYLTKSREQLQALCADRGYSKAGAKHELIAKLINSDLAQMTENYNSYVKKTKTELTKLFETEANPDSGPKLKEWNDEIVKHKKNLKDGAIQKRGAVKEYIEVMAKRDDTVENNELKAADDTDKRYIVDQFNFETTLLDLLKKKIALNAQQAVVTGSSESHAEKKDTATPNKKRRISQLAGFEEVETPAKRTSVPFLSFSGRPDPRLSQDN